MGSLYIDRLKSDFQRIEPCILRMNFHNPWSPQIFMEILGNQKCDDTYVPEESGVRNTVMNFLPKVPKIFTIGLRLDCKDNNHTNCPYWNINGLKTFFMYYFRLISRYFLQYI